MSWFVYHTELIPRLFDRPGSAPAQFRRALAGCRRAAVSAHRSRANDIRAGAGTHDRLPRASAGRCRVHHRRARDPRSGRDRGRACGRYASAMSSFAPRASLTAPGRHVGSILVPDHDRRAARRLSPGAGAGVAVDLRRFAGRLRGCAHLRSGADRPGADPSRPGVRAGGDLPHRAVPARRLAGGDGSRRAGDRRLLHAHRAPDARAGLLDPDRPPLLVWRAAPSRGVVLHRDRAAGTVAVRSLLLRRFVAGQAVEASPWLGARRPLGRPRRGPCG